MLSFRLDSPPWLSPCRTSETHEMGNTMRNTRAIAILVAVLVQGLVLVLPAAAGTTYYWDTVAGAGSMTAGSGTWSTNAGSNYQRWSTSTNGDASLVSWSASSNADFYANGTSTITVSGNQTVGNITFDGAGYTLSSGTLTFIAGYGVITANQNATISSTLSGGSSITITKSGAGVLTLTGSSRYTGQTMISAGTLQLGSGGTAGSINASSGVMDNSVLAFDLSTGPSRWPRAAPAA